jgi:DNA end-binding protein Ku
LPRKTAAKSRRKAEEPVESGAGVPRSFWTGTLSFGLVTIPVELYTATRSNRRSLRMLAPDGTPLSRRYFTDDGKPLDNADLERGYAVDDETFVVVEDKELERLLPEQSRDINLTRFVPEGSVPPLFYDRAYVLAPARGVSSAYRLLANTMERLGKVGIATFVMRERQYVVAISARDGVLRAETLRFADELRTPESVGIEHKREPSSDSLKPMRAAIKKLSSARLPARELKDSYWERLEKLVAEKKRKNQDVVELPESVEAEEGGAEIVDLMALLQKSLAENDQSGAKKKSARPGVKKARGSTPGVKKARSGASHARKKAS